MVVVASIHKTFVVLLLWMRAGGGWFYLKRKVGFLFEEGK